MKHNKKPEPVAESIENVLYKVDNWNSFLDEMTNLGWLKFSDKQPVTDHYVNDDNKNKIFLKTIGGISDDRVMYIMSQFVQEQIFFYNPEFIMHGHTKRNNLSNQFNNEAGKDGFPLIQIIFSIVDKKIVMDASFITAPEMDDKNKISPNHFEWNEHIRFRIFSNLTTNIKDSLNDFCKAFNENVTKISIKTIKTIHEDYKNLSLEWNNDNNNYTENGDRGHNALSDFFEKTETAYFYGVDNNKFALRPINKEDFLDDKKVFEAIEDGDDGYRSYLGTIEIAPKGVSRRDSDRNIFFNNPIAIVKMEKIDDTYNSFDGFHLVDVETGHVGLELELLITMTIIHGLFLNIM